MPRKPRSKATRFLLSGMIALGIAGTAVWYEVRPRLRSATESEIKAALPKELVEGSSISPIAEERFNRFAALTKNFSRFDFYALLEPSSSPEKLRKAANALYDQEKDLRKQISALLAQGPIEEPFKETGNLHDELTGGSAQYLLRYTAQAGKVLAENSEYAKSVETLVFAIRLCDAISAFGNGLTAYLIGEGIQPAVLSNIADAARTPGFPASSVMELLKAVTPAPKTDELLRQALRSDFQHNMVKLLQSPAEVFAYAEGATKGESDGERIYGSYDAIETAKSAGKLLATAMANTRKPFASADLSAILGVRAAVKSVPSEKATESGPWDSFVLRIALNKGDNTLGRKVLAKRAVTIDLGEVSCRWRALRDCTRVLLASIAYRSSHGGALASNASDLIPLLGAWPDDLYSGKPMIYIPAKQVVYSVGKNLKDDGGDVGDGRRASLDIGVSLKKEHG